MMLSFFCINIGYNQSFLTSVIPFLIMIVLLIPILIFIWRTNEPFMNYYLMVDFLTLLMVISIVSYIFLQGRDTNYYILFSLTSVIITQLISVRMWLVLLMTIILIIINTIELIVSQNGDVLSIIIETICVLVIFSVNLYCLRRSEISSKIDFILNESF